MKLRLLITLITLALLGAGHAFVSAAGPLDRNPQAAEPEITEAEVRVVADRPSVPGYERSCKAGKRCVFGPAWSDDVDVRHGRNGCDQRSDVLRETLEQIKIKPGTSGCVVASGVLHDPYTGQTVTYQRTGNTEVVADHVVPLAAAWDLGAAQWTPRKRQNFANDPRNLIITTSGPNLDKGDKTPGEWMPERHPCQYAQTYLEVASRYGVALTREDQRALSAAMRDC